MATILAITVALCQASISMAGAQPLRRDIRCGATITANTTLHHDLVNCPSNGLIIGRDNIVLDLNGHSIDGDGALVDGCSGDPVCDVGVSNTGKYSGLTIKGGTIKQFNVGVLLEGAGRARLRHLLVTRNHLAGVAAFESDHLRVEHSAITRNGVTTDFAGIGILDTAGAVIRNNRISGNGEIGLLAGGSFDEGRIVRNTVSRNTVAGIVVDGSRNHVRHNRVFGGAIVLAGDDNVLARNRVVRPARCGVGCGIGILVERGSRNLLARNAVVRPPVTGIRVEAYGETTTNTIVRGNIVRSAGVDGIAVNLDHVDAVTGTLLKKNVVSGSRDDGIDVESNTTTLRRNAALLNSDLGIEAVAGVRDGGGNYAARNGDRRQCTNIRCGGGSAGR